MWSLLAACCTACGDDPAAHGSAIAGGAGVLGSAGVAAGHGAGGAAGLGAGQAGTAGGAPISAGSGAAGFGAGGASGQIAGGAGGATGTSGGAAGAGAAGVGGAGMAGGQGGAAAGEGGAAGMAGEYAPCPATSEVCFILPLGDSITVGLGYSGGYRVELFRRALADGKSIDFTGSQSNGPTTVEGEPFPSNHEGHSGWKIDQLRSRIPMPALDEEPHIILLMIGTNDVAQNDDLANAPERLASLIDLLAMNAPEALIVVATLTPLSFGSGGVQSYNAAIPDVVEAAAAMGMHVLLVDMFTGFPASELGDGVHPNQQGYERMAGVWYEAIAPMLH